jgi:hypothetical protein
MDKLARFHLFGYFNAGRSIYLSVSKNLAYPYFNASLTVILFPCKTEVVIISMFRSLPQLEALHSVNTAIDQLVVQASHYTILIIQLSFLLQSEE